MRSKVLRELRQFKKHAQSNAWASYRSLIGRLCQEHSSFPFTNEVLGHVRNQNVRGLVECADSLSEQKYSDATQHFVANQFASLIRKYPFPSSLSPYEAKEEARRKWLIAEGTCAKSNEKFLGWLGSLEPKLFRMRAFIRYVIGDQPNYDRILKRCDFSPGASIGVHGNATNLARKLASEWSVTPGALNLAYFAISHNIHLMEILFPRGEHGIFCIDSVAAFQQFLSRVQVIQHNKIAFVPKTVKVERPIAVEPLLNGFLQKGIDLQLRDLLSRVGIDLSDQTINQDFAREGSSDGPDDFVTIDLSSASDSVATEVVRNLLPHDWFVLLDNCRSKHYLDVDGEIHPYHKFCSMGNGFCFPLETLIFAAACNACDCAVPGSDFVVYGDDIIVRKTRASAVIDLLAELGFSTNANKTFLEGPFRESCGSDWFSGEDVRPFTLDFALDSVESYFKFLNLSERNARSREFFRPLRDFIISQVPKSLRFCRPFDGNADSGYKVELDQFQSSPYAKWDTPLQCWSWSELIHTPISDDWSGLRCALYAYQYAAYSGFDSNKPFTVRRKTRTTVRRVAHG